MTFKNCEGKTISELFVFCEDTVTKRIGSELLTFGENTNGTLGNNSTVSDTKLKTLSTVDLKWSDVQMSKGGAVIAFKNDNNLWSWGLNSRGQLGLNDTVNRSSPSQVVSNATNWASFSLYADHASGVKLDGTLWTWGNGTCGSLGNSNTTDISSPVQTISGGNNWKNSSSGCLFTNAVKSDGTLWAWGLNAFGSLGDGTTVNKSSPVQNISTSCNWRFTAAGLYTSLGIKIDGTLWGWGDSAGIGVGNPANLCFSSPVQTSAGGTNWKKISTSGRHSAAIKANGTLWTWGYNDLSQLGNASTVNVFSPQQICSLSSNWRDIKTGYKSTTGVKSDNCLCLWGKMSASCQGTTSGFTEEAFIWGYAPSALTGGNSLYSRINPTKMFPNTLNCCWRSFSAGGAVGRAAAAIDSNNNLFVAGTGFVIPNTCGYFNNQENVYTCFFNVPGSWNCIALGSFNAAAIKTDGTLWTWGSCDRGALGRYGVNAYSPVQTVAGGSNWCSVASSSIALVSALKTDGTLWLWGANCTGTLGDNSAINKSSPVQTVAGGTNWCRTAVGQSSFGIKNDGTLWGWGFGGCGLFTTFGIGNRSSPVQILGSFCWREISHAGTHAGALRSDNTFWTWGEGAFGALGNNSTLNRSSPVQTVSAGSNWCCISVGCRITAGIKTDSTLWIWGFSCAGGPPGISRIGTSSPVQVTSGSTSWKIVEVGGTGGTPSCGGATIAVACCAATSFNILTVGEQACGFNEAKKAATNGESLAILKYKED